jgi:antitoxin ParD1/3/4
MKQEGSMPRNASVTLGSHYEYFVDAQVQNGGFCSRSEVIRAGLSLLELHQAKLAALKHAIAIGLESTSVECSYQDFMTDMENDGLNR